MALKNLSQLPPLSVGLQQCAACGGALGDSLHTANGHPLCHACFGMAQRELAGANIAGSDLVTGFLGGFLGAVAGGAAWAAVALSFAIQAGPIALGIGWLVAMGTRLGAGNKTGRPLQLVAALNCFAGIYFGHYFTWAHPQRQALAAQGLEVSWFNGKLLADFTALLEQVLSPWDLLWLGFALLTAWRVAAAPAVRLGR